MQVKKLLDQFLLSWINFSSIACPGHTIYFGASRICPVIDGGTLSPMA